ncbi:XrtA system polysaccharide chain length determinant [Marinimicrobium sp. ABcell2]|uniref:XrtA system polysaccharide chain length determinant n=1 Tax=Marinimicrobium sp. ABcell2 TaxID=3069751 RepID=UPI0027B5D98B|nr:XrtA system polysaccharide chain length determinant [Marinimicrobium sp. ABcell2]MDQ2076193.1 chain length-determining protein [Marinimicrobium sp. ABcell2]
MDTTYIKELLRALKLEAIRFRVTCVLLFIAVAFFPLAVGYMWPNSYYAEALISAEESNIIEPLMRGRASVSDRNRADRAEEIIFSRQFLETAAKDAGFLDESMAGQERTRAIGQLRSGLNVQSEGRNHFRVSHTARDPDVAFQAVNSVVSAFLQHAARTKREESLGAYTFIDTQVQSYKRQLEEAEERLKQFRSQNTDGTEATVTARINELRNQIESLQIAIEESESRISSLKSQLENEGRYLSARGRSDDLRERRQTLQTQLEALRLRFQENYPDVVSLREQIAALDDEIAEVELFGGSFGGGGGSERVENPLYDELRKQLAAAEVELSAQQRRMRSLVHLQEQEYKRAERVAANQAELSELTRDYNVTRDVYEEMLQRKESARLSMALDIEGQGVNYQIQDPARYPTDPSGLQFVHFAVIGPFVGFMAPIGLLFLFVLLDPHFRSARAMQQSLPEGIDLMGSIPHYHTPLSERLMRKDMLLLFGLSLLAMAGYVSLAISWYEVKS